MKDNPTQFRQYALQGFLLGLLPLEILTVYADNPYLTVAQEQMAGGAAAVLLITAAAVISKYRRWGQVLGTAGIMLNLFLLSGELIQEPLAAMAELLLSLAALYYLFTARLRHVQTVSSSLQLERVIGCSGGCVLLGISSPLLSGEWELFALVCAVSLFILLITIGKYCRLKRYFLHSNMVKSLLFAAAAALGVAAWYGAGDLAAFLAAPAVLIAALRQKHADLKYLELIVARPARCLVLTFMALCIVGTLLLRTPPAMDDTLGVLDAAFTAVSAVCVTGLSVIDISADLTTTGQIFLLLLIQLGGLGIMTLTALVLHALGRLSLSGEQLIAELTQGSGESVFDNLRLIVRFTLVAELIGAGLLSWGFFHVHGEWLHAVKLGVFTSVSAFCNAGFFPGNGSLEPYCGEKLLLMIIALEIIAGGMAPAVTWSFLKIRQYRRLPFISKLVLGTNFILIVGGTFLLLLFEWDGIFRELPWYDKLVNGFFQSVTLRTAGFNTVSFSALGVPAYLIMLPLMFIGGSPGGTAGGIKTTTLAVLALTFRAAVRNDAVVTVDSRRIAWRNIVQAVAVLLAALVVLMAAVMMLTATQMLPLNQLVFEAVSALATVGLSLDCTGELDPVGRLIIMAAMFIGRIGPLTLFCFLSDRQSSGLSGYPQIKIPMG